MSLYDTAAILQATDLLALVGETVRLKKQGTQHYGLCPLHNDTSPTLRVDPKKQLWYCPSCLTGGDAIDWLVKTEGLPFRDAAAVLAKRAGIDGDDKSVAKLPAPAPAPQDPKYPHPQHESTTPWGGQSRMIGAPAVLILHEFPGRRAWFRWREVGAVMAGAPSCDVIWWPTAWDGQHRGSDTPAPDRMHLPPIALQAILQAPARNRYEYERARQLERLVVRFRGYRIAGRSHARGIDRAPSSITAAPAASKETAREGVQGKANRDAVAA